MKMNTYKTNRAAILVCLASLFVVSWILSRYMVNEAPSPFTVEVLASVVAIVLVVSTVIATVVLQHEADVERHFKITFFEKKLEMFREIVNWISAMDDDAVITDAEIKKLRNLSITISLVSSQEVIVALAAFIERIDRERRFKADQGGDNTLSWIVQAMRRDLSAATEANVANDIGCILQKQQRTPERKAP